MWRYETSRGYSRIHIPLGIREVSAPIFVARCSNLWAAIVNGLTSRNPELRDPKVLAVSSKMKGLATQSYGEITLQLQSVYKADTKFNLGWDRLA